MKTVTKVALTELRTRPGWPRGLWFDFSDGTSQQVVLAVKAEYSKEAQLVEIINRTIKCP